ncbi:MAG: hypothetical protein ACQESP_07810 [Candidatus Muiribacteriota bacterium]
MDDIESFENNTTENLNDGHNEPDKSGSGIKNAHFILKFFIKEVRDEFEGAMVIIGDTNEPGFTNVSVVIDKSLNFDINIPWDKFLEEIKIKKKEVIEKSSNFLVFLKKMESFFSKSISKSKIDKLKKTIVTTEDETLRNTLIKAMFDEEITKIISHGFEVEIDMIAEVNYYQSEQSNSDEEGGDASDSQEGEKAEELILDVIPMIEPNGGLKASEVQNKDKIFVRIVDDSIIGKHIARSITSSDNPEEVPVISPVTNVEKKIISKFRASSEVIEIKIKLDEGVYGKLVVQTDVRLKRKIEDDNEPEDELPEPFNEDDPYYNEEESEGNLLSVVVITLIILLFLYLIIRFLG